MNYTEEQLDQLRSEVEKRETPARFRHTLGVEREAAALGELLEPDSVSELRAAAILHDLTKSFTDAEQIKLMRAMGLPHMKAEEEAPQILHGHTAAALIPREFPAFATPRIIHAVQVHTTGSENMSIFDKIIFLADYIEIGRHYPDCRAMREAFWNVPQDILCSSEHLDGVVRRVLENTIRFLKERQLPIDEETVRAYRDICRKSGIYPTETTP